MKQAITILMFFLACAAMAVAQAPTPSMATSKLDVSVNYMYQGSHTLEGASFSQQGGRADVSYAFRKHMALVGEFGGSGSNGSAPFGNTQLTYLGGLRLMTTPTGNKGLGKFSLFTQGLVGGAHGMNGTFPHVSTIYSSADSMAFSVGGGVQVKACQKVDIRLFQADYLYTQFYNLVNTHQNQVRLGFGVVYHIH